MFCTSLVDVRRTCAVESNGYKFRMAAFFVIMDGDIVGECIRAVTEMMSKRKVLSAN